MLDVEIYEVDYSVSPGGVNCWEMIIGDKCYSDFKTAGEALNHILLIYPEKELNVNVMSLATYFKLEEEENAKSF